MGKVAGMFEAWNAYMSCREKCQSKGLKKMQPFVTISRQTGAGGISIGQELTLYLRMHDKEATCPWTVLDQNLVKRVLDEHHLPDKTAQFMSEKKSSDIRDMVEEMFGLHPAEWTLVHETSETIMNLAHLGNVILVGRGAHRITRTLPLGFHVRLVGSLEKRITHVEDYYGLSHKEAQKKVKIEDAQRKDYLKQHFNCDIDNPLLYHMVLNTDHISYKAAALTIGERVICSREDSQENDTPSVFL